MKFSLPAYGQSRNMSTEHFHNYLWKKNMLIPEVYNQQEAEKLVLEKVNAKLESVAYHEAGHIFEVVESLYHLLTAGTIQPYADYVGNVTFEDLFSKSPRIFLELENMSVYDQQKIRQERIKVSLAGLISQQILDPDFKYYSPNKMLDPNDIIDMCGNYIYAQHKFDTPDQDEIKVTTKYSSGDLALIEAEIQDQLLGESFPQKNFQEASEGEFFQNQVKHRRAQLKSKEFETIKLQKFLEIILKYYPEVYQTLRDNKEILMKIADLLLKEGTISGEKVYALMNKKYPLKNRYSFNEEGTFVSTESGTHDVYGHPKPKNLSTSMSQLSSQQKLTTLHPVPTDIIRNLQQYDAQQEQPSLEEID
jgi:hypothetical protein